MTCIAILGLGYQRLKVVVVMYKSCSGVYIL